MVQKPNLSQSHAVSSVQQQPSHSTSTPSKKHISDYILQHNKTTTTNTAPPSQQPTRIQQSNNMGLTTPQQEASQRYQKQGIWLSNPATVLPTLGASSSKQTSKQTSSTISSTTSSRRPSAAEPTPHSPAQETPLISTMEPEPPSPESKPTSGP